MSIDIAQWRATIGQFNSFSFWCPGTKSSKSYSNVFRRFLYVPLFFVTSFIVFLSFALILIVCSIFSYFSLLKPLSIYLEYFDQFFVTIKNEYIFLQLSLIFSVRIFSYYIWHFSLTIKSNIRLLVFNTGVRRLIYITYCLILPVSYWDYFSFLLLESGDVETNPGPERTTNFSVSHWNLNGITAHNYTKVSLLSMYLSLYNIDVLFYLKLFSTRHLVMTTQISVLMDTNWSEQIILIT